MTWRRLRACHLGCFQSGTGSGKSSSALASLPVGGWWVPKLAG